MRQIVLDTETTGIEISAGNRIIEIGCVEMIDRRLTGNNYHEYIQPDHEVEEGAFNVHGISNEFLSDKPRMSKILPSFLEYVHGAELIIHNAPFDCGFINHEMKLENPALGKVEDNCSIIDTLAMARADRPGQRNTLDALCKVYAINNSHRELHGALLDAQILADVYLAMTGGQRGLFASADDDSKKGQVKVEHRAIERTQAFRVIQASAEENQAHAQVLEAIGKACGGEAIWTRDASADDSGNTH